MRVILVVTLTIFGIVSQIDAAVLCTAKSGEGTIRIRDACKKNEMQLDLVELGLQRPTAVVKDANGTVIGSYVPPAFNLPDVVLMNLDGSLLLANVSDLGFLGSFSAVYESNDCTGPVFLNEGQIYAPSSSFLNVHGGIGAGTTFYYPLGPLASLTARSRAQISSSIAGSDSCSSPQFFIPPHTCCMATAATEGMWGPLKTLVIPEFVPPFRVEMQP